MDNASSYFSTIFAVLLYVRPLGAGDDDWREFDRGPGYFHIPEGSEAQVRIASLNNKELAALIADLEACPAVTFLNLAESRKISDAGIPALKALPQLAALNLSSCDITNKALPHLTRLPRLTYLNLSYCNRITNEGLKALANLRNLTFLDLQGTIKINQAGIARLRRPGLTIHK